MNLLIFGPPGIGKTWVLGTICQLDPLKSAFLVDLDGGTDTILSKVIKIDYKELNDITPVPGKFHALRCTEWSQVDRIRNKANKILEYDYICFDNLTEMGNQATDDSLEKHPDAKRWDDAVPFRGDYQVGQAYIRRLIRPFVNKAKNIICVCHEAEKTDEQGVIKSIRPKVLGNNWRDFCGIMDHVGYMYKENSKRHMRFTEGNKIVGPKYRHEFQALEEPISEPTIQKILTRINKNGS